MRKDEPLLHILHHNAYDNKVQALALRVAPESASSIAVYVETADFL